MSTHEFTTKIFISYKYSLFTIFVISALTVASTVGYAAKIGDQQSISDPVEYYIDALNNVEAG